MSKRRIVQKTFSLPYRLNAFADSPICQTEGELHVGNISERGDTSSDGDFLPVNGRHRRMGATDNGCRRLIKFNEGLHGLP